MTLGSVQEDVVGVEEQELEQEARDDTPLDAKADGASPAQQRDAADGSGDVGPLRALSAYVVVLRDRKEGGAQMALDMASRSVSPQRVGCLLDFVSQLNTSLVRLWCVLFASIHSSILLSSCSCSWAHHVLIFAVLSTRKFIQEPARPGRRSPAGQRAGDQQHAPRAGARRVRARGQRVPAAARWAPRAVQGCRAFGRSFASSSKSSECLPVTDRP